MFWAKWKLLIYCVIIILITFFVGPKNGKEKSIFIIFFIYLIFKNKTNDLAPKARQQRTSKRGVDSLYSQNGTEWNVDQNHALADSRASRNDDQQNDASFTLPNNLWISPCRVAGSLSLALAVFHGILVTCLLFGYKEAVGKNEFLEIWNSSVGVWKNEELVFNLSLNLWSLMDLSSKFRYLSSVRSLGKCWENKKKKILEIWNCPLWVWDNRKPCQLNLYFWSLMDLCCKFYCCLSVSLLRK